MENQVNQENEYDKKARENKRNNTILILIIVIVLIVLVASLAASYFKHESKTTTIGFENIGVLCTQSSYCTVVETIKDPRKVFGVKIPFTESVKIYSYDVIVKAGLDFSKIKWKINNNKIVISMPAAYVTDYYEKKGSIKVYHEKDSVFSPITTLEKEEADKELLERAKEDAIENGILDNAKENAEALLKSFFLQHKEYANYEFEFKWEE